MIAKSTHVDLVRQHQRRLARQQRAQESRTGISGARDLDSAVAYTSSGQEDWLARVSVAEEIDRLPRAQREVARRMFFLEMSAREIAAELGIEAQTVRKHARAARETLRVKLAEDGDG